MYIERKVFERAGKPGKLGHREPESGIGVQGVQGVQGEICAGCAGVHGVFLKISVQVCTVFSKTFLQVCRCARSFQKLFLSGDVHTKNFFEPVCTLHRSQKVFQIALHRCTETFSNRSAPCTDLRKFFRSPRTGAQDLCKSPCTPCTGSTFSGEKSLKNRLGRVYYPAGGRDHEGFDQQRLQF